MSPLHPTTRFLGACALCLAAAGCGGGGDEAAPAPIPNVTASGGTVVSDDGKATLAVPAGAASAPATVTLTRAAASAPAGAAAFLEGTTYRLGGDGGALAAAAELTFTSPVAFPAGFLPDRGGRSRALYAILADAPCDVNGDGLVDTADAVLWSEGYACFERPRLVAAATAPLAALGDCLVPQNVTIICRVPSLAPTLLALQFDAVAPTVGIVSFDGPMKPQKLTQPGTYTLEVAASDNLGVARVDFYAVSWSRGNVVRSKLSTATAPPYRGAIALSSADNGKVDSFVAEAVDTWGNVAGRGVGLVVDIAAPPPVDTTPPLVVAQASSLVVQVGGPLTITATASDDVGVVRIEFLKNGTKVAESATVPAALQVLATNAADLGTVVYTVRAFDAAGNVGTKTFNITVAPAAGEAWVHAGASDANPGTATSPFKTLAKAFATVGPNGTVWLAGTTVVTPTSEGLSEPQAANGLAVPAGVTIQAVSQGGPAIGIPLAFAAGGHLVDLRLDVSTGGRVLASGGVVTLNRVRWVRSGTLGLEHGLVVTGNALVTLGAIGQPDFEYVDAGLVALASVADSAELTVVGGRIDGTGQQGGFTLDGTAKLRLEGVRIIRSKGSWMSSDGVIHVGGTANRVDLIGVTIDLGGGLTTACIVQDRAVAGAVTDARIVLQGSTLANCGGGGIQLREGISSVGLFGSAIVGSGRHAIEAGRIGFDSGRQFGRPEIGLLDSQLTGNYLGSVRMNQGGVLTMHGSTLSGGARAIVLEGADQRYLLMARQSTLSAGSDAVLLQGDAGSLFDLGTGSGPGNNVLAGSTLLRLSVGAGVLVRAIGNTWHPNVQGADAAGRYGTALCGGVSPCEVTSGSGANYAFDGAGAGARLRLAEQ